MANEDEFSPRKAVKSKVKLKLAVDGPSGSGKTYSGLALACYLAQLIAEAAGRPGTGKVIGVDTENESMALYADEFDFEHVIFRPPYTTTRYTRAMQQAIIHNADVLFVDSISHQWEGQGGIRSRKDELDSKGGNSFTNWAKLSPEHTDFIEYIKQLPIHTICTMRTKTEYVMQTNDKGKQVPVKVGMAPVQREGMDYEFSIVFEIDADHMARATKDRTRLNGNPLFTDAVNLASPAVAQKIWDWLNSGAAIVEKFIGSDERLKIRTALKEHGKEIDDLMMWVDETMGFKETKDIPISRLYEILTWIATPVEVSQEEKIARQTMAAWGWTPAQKSVLISKHRKNWTDINEELDFIEAESKRDASQNQSHPPTDAPATSQVQYDAPHLTLTVLKATRKESTPPAGGGSAREFYHVDFPVTIEGKWKSATCWHKSRFPALSYATGQRCHLLVSLSKDGKNMTIDDVLQVGDQEWKEGKIVSAVAEGNRE